MVSSISERIGSALVVGVAVAIIDLFANHFFSVLIFGAVSSLVGFIGIAAIVTVVAFAIFTLIDNMLDEDLKWPSEFLEKLSDNRPRFTIEDTEDNLKLYEEIQKKAKEVRLMRLNPRRDQPTEREYLEIYQDLLRNCEKARDSCRPEFKSFFRYYCIIFNIKIYRITKSIPVAFIRGHLEQDEIMKQGFAEDLAKGRNIDQDILDNIEEIDKYCQCKVASDLKRKLFYFDEF